jgi:hypothetical protein
MGYYLSHPDRNVKTYFNKIQTEWTQIFNRNRQKYQNTKGPKTMYDLQFLGRWI